MCGFFGWFGTNPNLEKNIINYVSDSLKHRGPDDEGISYGSNYLMGFRRLSILDLTHAANQPFSSDDGRYHLVFNGEIYNFQDLIELLPSEYLPLKSSSDTEVLFKLLIYKRENALQYLNGMFAFSFIDTKSNTCIIARDRLGVKPLYYSVEKGTFYFASELPSLLKFGLEKTINKVALNQFIRFGQINAPATIFNNIQKLEPGSYLSFSLNKVSNVISIPWWNLNVEEDNDKTEQKWLEEIDEMIFNATKIRLISDVPLGVFLSGGIDSSLIAHYTSIQSISNKPIALSVKFDDKEYNEFQVAQKVAKAKGLELIPISITESDLNQIEIALNNLGEPFTDSSILNQYNLSKEARKHATVFLTGDGGDESFAGYSEYIYSKRIDNLLPHVSMFSKTLYPILSKFLSDDNNLKQQLSKLALGPHLVGTAIRINHQEPLLKALIKKEFMVDETEILSEVYAQWSKSEGLPFTKRLQLFDLKNYLEPDVLVKVDRATMLNSIESRSPFLDYRIVELAMQIPTKYNVYDGLGKQLLRKLAAKNLPEEVCKLPKKGFGLPYRKWLTDDVKKQLIALNKVNNHGFWSNEVFIKIVDNGDSYKYDYYSIFWRIWIFEIWYANCFLVAKN